MSIMLFAIASQVRKKRKNFKINRESGRIKKNGQKAEDLPLYRKTWQVCRGYTVVHTSVFNPSTYPLGELADSLLTTLVVDGGGTRLENGNIVKTLRWTMQKW